MVRQLFNNTLKYRDVLSSLLSFTVLRYPSRSVGLEVPGIPRACHQQRVFAITPIGVEIDRLIYLLRRQQHRASFLTVRLDKMLCIALGHVLPVVHAEARCHCQGSLPLAELDHELAVLFDIAGFEVRFSRLEDAVGFFGEGGAEVGKAAAGLKLLS